MSVSKNEGEGQSPKLTPLRLYPDQKFEAFMRAIADFLRLSVVIAAIVSRIQRSGDLSYGEKLFCTLDGSSYAYASAFTAFGQRVSALKKPQANIGPFRPHWRIHFGSAIVASHSLPAMQLRKLGFLGQKAGRRASA